MARGRKSYTLEEKYENIIQDIEKTKLHLESLEEEKKILESKIKQQRLEEIDRMISESGKSFEEVKGLLFAQ